MAKTQSMTIKPVIVFDFDGTLVDTFTLALTIFNHVTRRGPMPDEDISRLRGLSARELMSELHVHFWQIPLLGFRTRRLIAKRLNSIELIPGIEDTVRELSKRYHLFILTSNTASNVRNVLQRFGIADQFVGIYGSAGILHKEHSLRRLLAQNQLKPANVWYVGDEARDVEAAHHVGMPVVAVSWGFNNIAALERHHPDKLVFSPDELVEHFGKIYES